MLSKLKYSFKPKPEEKKIQKELTLKQEQKEELKDSDSEYEQVENKDEIDTEDIQDEDKEDIFTNPICEFGGKFNLKMFKMLFSDIREPTNMLYYNREVNLTHVKEIEEGIKQYKYCSDPIKIAKDKNGKLHLLDGHHRFKGMENIYSKSKGKDHITVLVLVYQVDDIEDEDSLKLYKQLNNVIPVRDSDLLQVVISDAVKDLRNQYKDGPNDMIKDKKKSHVNKPHLEHGI